MSQRPAVENTEKGYADHCSVDTVLGLAPRDGKMVLLVKDNDGKNEAEDTPYPLLEAARDIRIAALQRLEELLTVLWQIAKETIDAIDEGRELAEQL